MYKRQEKHRSADQAPPGGPGHCSRIVVGCALTADYRWHNYFREPHPGVRCLTVRGAIRFSVVSGLIIGTKRTSSVRGAYAQELDSVRDLHCCGPVPDSSVVAGPITLCHWVPNQHLLDCWTMLHFVWPFVVSHNVAPKLSLIHI